MSDLLAHVFAPDVLRAIEELVDRQVERKLAELGRDDWLCCREASQVLGCSPAALRERARRGTVPYSVMARKLYFRRGDLFDALERQRR